MRPQPRKHSRTPAAKPVSVAQSFGLLLREMAAAPERALTLDAEPAPLGGLDYAVELELKNAALRRFWEKNRLPDKPARIIPSPLPRH
jgi:hypothetical protein